ncbi:hypothetical_protein_-_conserved [Leishmania major strain Friedlin]|nr:hypothetical_protein_-_conserved [Leishmania major strain Friedlin]
MATAAAEAACVTCSTALCSSSTLTIDRIKRRLGSHCMDKTTSASTSEGSAYTTTYSGSAVLAEHHHTRPRVRGFCRGDSRGARWMHRLRRALRLTERAAVCALYLLLPFLLYYSTPPSASQRLPPARASITAALLAPFLCVRAVEYDLSLAFQANDHVDSVCVPGATAARTSVQAPPTSTRGSAMKEAAVGPTVSTARAAAIDLSACPHYSLWSLLAGVNNFGETTRVDGGNVDAAAASRAGARGGVDSSTRPVDRHGRAAAAEAEARRRIPTATPAAAPSAASTAHVVPGDLTSTLSGSRNALTYYYQVLNTDNFFFMLQGCTIQITIDGDVPPSYAYNTFQRYADGYALNVSATGKDGSISGGSGVRGTLASSAGTRTSGAEGDGDEAYPNITPRTAFFFWNQPRLHCTYNAPALMSMMIDLANQHHHRRQPEEEEEEPRRAFLKDDAVLAEAGVQPADGEAAAGRPAASSTGPLYPSCAASMPPPQNILPSGGRNTTLTVNYMQLGSSVVVKIFSFDVWYQLTGTPVLATHSAARTTTTAAPASAAYSAVFSSDPITRSSSCSTGASTKNLAAGQSLKLPGDPEKVCTAPALYTISLNPLLARASSWSLGSSTDWLQPSVMVTHDYPAARVIAVVAQCSGVPLSFAVKVNFLNPGKYPGSGQHYATFITYLFFLACYALLLIVFLVMIVPCSKRRRRRRRRGQGRQRRGGGAEGGESTSSSPGQARAADKTKRASAGSDQRSADKNRGGSVRGRRSGSAAAGGDGRDGHRQDDDGGEEMHGTSAPNSTTAKYAAPESMSAAVKGMTKVPPSPSSSSPTSVAAVAARTRASAQRGAAESDQDNAEDEPLHREEGESSRQQRRGGAGPQQQQGQRVVERRDGVSEGDDSQQETSSLYTAHSNAHHTSSSGIYDETDINCGSSDAASEAQARRGASGRRRAQSRRRRGPSTLSLSTSGDDSDCSSSTTTTTTTTDSTSDDDDSRAARRRRRQKEQRRAKRGIQKQKKQRSRPRRQASATSTSRCYAANNLNDDRRGSSTGTFAAPLRWRFRAVGMANAVGHHVLDPVRLWWAESHILVMHAPIQWLVLVLLVLRCLLSVLLASKFFLLSGAVRRDSLMGNSLPLVCVIFEVATDTLLIPIEMLVAMGWGLAFTAPLPTNQIVTVGFATLMMFIVLVFSAACAKDGLSMSLTANRHARLINSNLCNTVAYTRAAFEMVCRVHNVLRMFFLSLWLSKTVVPADAAAVQRQRRQSHRQLQGAQSECREGQGMAGPRDGSSDGAWCKSDHHRRTSSASSSSSSGQCDGSSLVTADTTTPSSAPIALRLPPRLGYPGVSLSAMDVYLRYRGMRVPFAMLLVWAVLLLVFAFTVYQPEDYYMVIAFRELQSVYLLGFIILFLRTSSPLYC